MPGALIRACTISGRPPQMLPCPESMWWLDQIYGLWFLLLQDIPQQQPSGTLKKKTNKQQGLWLKNPGGYTAWPQSHSEVTGSERELPDLALCLYGGPWWDSSGFSGWLFIDEFKRIRTRMKAWEGKSMGRVTPGASYLAHWRLSEGGAWGVGQPGSLAQCLLAVWFFAMGTFEVGALAVKRAYITIKKPTCQALTLVRETEDKEKLIYQCEVTKIILRAHCDTCPILYPK